MTAVVAIVMAGGHGARLWPLTATRPKALLTLPGERRTLLARTIAMATDGAMDVRVSVGKEHAEAVARVTSRDSLLVEPASRGTAASLLYAARRLARLDPVLVLLSCDADHRARRRTFAEAIASAVEIARAHDVVVSPGAHATAPNVSYGLMEAMSGDALPSGAWRCGRLVEKPARERAETLLASGRWLFHVGALVGRASVIVRLLDRHARDELAPLLDANRASLARAYAACASTSFDEALLERIARSGGSEHVLVETGTRFRDVARDFEAFETDARASVRPTRIDRVTRLSAREIVVSSEDGDVLVLPRRPGARQKADQEVLLASRAPHVRGIRRVVLSGVRAARVEWAARGVTIEPGSKRVSTVVITRDERVAAADAASWLVARLASVIEARGHVHLLLSAGRSPLGLYAALRADHRRTIDWARVRAFQLDELAHADGRAAPIFARMLEREIVGPLRVGSFERLTASSRARIERTLDPSHAIAIHGIGTNGHLALNEPAARETALRALAPSSIRSLRRAGTWRAASDPCGITLGLPLLSRVGHSLLLAFGATKRHALSRFFARDRTLPASALHACPSLFVVCDARAYAEVGT